MQGHNNTAWITFQLWSLLAGVPLLCLIASIQLWRRAGHSQDVERQPYQRIGFAILSLVFLLCVASLIPVMLPAQSPIARLGLLLAYLPPFEVLAVLAAAVLVALNTRRLVRAAGLALSCVALVYCCFTIFAVLTGGGGL